MNKKTIFLKFISTFAFTVIPAKSLIASSAAPSPLRISPSMTILKCSSIFSNKAQELKYPEKSVLDISRTELAKTYTAEPSNSDQIREIIQQAGEFGLKITIKGTNHSHGGHNRRSGNIDGTPRAIQIDTKNLNKILLFDAQSQEVTVEPGVTWKDLSVFLNDRGFAAMTQQSSNIFSIGGSVATNVHGRDIHGPLVNSILELTFIDSRGQENTVHREVHPDIFKALIGGYGGLGVITKIKLKVEKNYLYEAQSQQDVTVTDYIEYLKILSKKSKDRMHYGRVNISGSNSFSKVSYVEWIPIPENSKAQNWPGWKLDLVEKNRAISSFVMNMMRYRPTSEFGKKLKDFLDKYFGLPKNGMIKTKNNILNNPVQFLFDNFYNKEKSVDILQEYFIPVNNVEPFLKTLKSVTKKYNLDLMNVTLRFVPKVEKDQDSLLSPYSDQQDLVAVVLYYNIQENKNLSNGSLVLYDGKVWTQELIQSAHDLQGSFYWPYHRWWSEKQIRHQREDKIKKYFEIKDQVDPTNLFESEFIYYLRKAQNTTQPE